MFKIYAVYPTRAMSQRLRRRRVSLFKKRRTTRTNGVALPPSSPNSQLKATTKITLKPLSAI